MSNLAQNSNARRSQEDYITQVSEEIEGRVTKRLSKEFSRTESRILGAKARLDDILMHPLLQGHYGTTLEPSRNALTTIQGTNGDDSQNDLHPEAGLFHGQMAQNSGPEDGHNMVTGVTEQNRNRRDMVTGVQRKRVCSHDVVTGAIEQMGNCHDMTGVHEEVTYCPASTSSGKQKKKHFHPQFRSENTPATIEADQILLALQQLANNNNSANFQNNINKISKLPKSLTTTMPTFDGKTEKFDLYEVFFRTSLKIHNHLTADDRINYFYSLMTGDALQTFKNTIGPTRENLGEILEVFRRKHVKPQSMATEKHKFQKLVFNPAN